LSSDTSGCDLRVTVSHGEHPVWLAVRVDIDLLDSAPAFPSTEVTDGRC
jgi:hypothetical protein